MGRSRPAKIVAAMSGGVDSSVAAALLKEQGYDVIGVTLRVMPADNGSPDDAMASESAGAGAGTGVGTGAGTGTGPVADPITGPVADPIADAEHVARALGIPHRVLDVSGLFEERVISYFCQEYALGRTPNPCIVCNRRIKFGELVRVAREMGATHVATGHYARTRYDAALGRHLLLRGSDPRKDQSYVLYSLRQDQISAAMFPIGGMRKEDVRRIAAQMGIPVADKPESQEICFIASGDYRSFVEERCPMVAREGPIVDTSGRALGRHRGLAFYTVGQRKGLGVAIGAPLYVVRLDYQRNTLVVGSAYETLRSGCQVSDPNFIPFPVLTGRMKVTCKIRYRAEETPAIIDTIINPAIGPMIDPMVEPTIDPMVDCTVDPMIEPDPDSTISVTFSSPQRSITPGQAAVFYDGEVVVGGGIIQ